MTIRKHTTAAVTVAGILVALGAMLGAHMAMADDAARPPAASEFGLGPRASSAHLYSVTLEPARPLRARTMQTIQVSVRDAEGRPVEDAQIRVDGGMPQHGHGLPTNPRVTGALGNGVYTLDGVRFNMRGWWELRLSITTASGTDVVTFNLNL